ncbi:hypothetical protein HMPREF1548_05246 [Clostridium sp. KLE 1755]|nr:hypothetical protein HMPREF1548_05246 [Clostridium sp. KLE 1755]
MGEKDMENADCPCKRTKCIRYGNCDACREHHHCPERNTLTACERRDAKNERKNKRKWKGGRT